jgi:predicted RNA-binding protein (virulence factor B family)
VVEIGKFNQLTVGRASENGFYLKDDAGQEVLLPNAYIPDGLSLRDPIIVFVYTDSEDRMVATTLQPKILLNEFALLKVLHTTKFGAFMDWGLPKDLLVPFSEQPHKLAEGEWHVVYLYLDEKTDRLVGSAHVAKFLDNSNVSFKPGDEVDLMVYNQTELGYKAVINNKHQGLLFRNEVFQALEMGYQTKGYIKKVREDNKIDVSLQRFGYRNIAPNVDKVLSCLKDNKGYLALTDNSKPEDIVKVLGMSKKTFKKAVGDLYRQRKIRIEADGIYLV